jgi:hypothetical protein
MLKPITRQPAAGADPSTTLTVATYRGIQDGWVPVGGPREPGDAMRMLHIVERLRNTHASALLR